ncbi:MAG: MerR family transcriptional regulator [Thermodesulfovibrionales bacterium]
MGDFEETPNEFSLSPVRLFYKIGDVAKLIGVESHVIRYWERAFPEISPSRSRSGQRVYTKKDIELLLYIKRLQYEEGYTLDGVKKRLQEEKHATKKVSSKVDLNLIRYIKSRLREISDGIKI